MLRLRPRAAHAAIVVALCATAASPAAAQEGGGDAVEQARALYEQGLQAARAESWQEALALFERSYELAPRPATLLNLAAALSETGHLVRAAESYRRFVDEAAGSSASQHLAAARQALRAVEARVPRLHVFVLGSTEADRVLLDGRQVSPSLEGGQWVDPGEHLLELWRGGALVGHETVTLAEREDRRVTLGTSVAEPDPAPLVAPTPVVETPEERAARRRSMQIAGIVLWSVAAAAIGTFGGLYGVGEGLYREWEAEDAELRSIYRMDPEDPDRPPPDEIERRQETNDELWRRIDVMGIAQWTLLALGVAALATGFGVYFGAPQEEEPAISVLPWPGGLALAVRLASL